MYRHKLSLYPYRNNNIDLMGCSMVTGHKLSLYPYRNNIIDTMPRSMVTGHKLSLWGHHKIICTDTRISKTYQLMATPKRTNSSGRPSSSLSCTSKDTH